jgi:40S ribosome biogenesis protein Tsr1 and BMS1 C-terminal
MSLASEYRRSSGCVSPHCSWYSCLRYLIYFRTAPDLVATGSFMNPDPKRIIAKRIILTGHPFKVNKKTATIRYMFFNPGARCLAWSIHCRAVSNSLCRGCGVFRPRPAPYEARTRGPHPGIVRYPWLLQSTLRWADQPDGYGVLISVQARVPEVDSAMEGVRSVATYPKGRRDGRVIILSRVGEVCF